MQMQRRRRLDGASEIVSRFRQKAAGGRPENGPRRQPDYRRGPEPNGKKRPAARPATR